MTIKVFTLYSNQFREGQVRERSRGLMLESRTRNPRVASSSLRSGRNCRWGSEWPALSSSFNTTTEVSLSKTPNCSSDTAAQMAAHCSGSVFAVCVFTAVCVNLGWIKCRAQILSMGHRTWPCHVSFTFLHACFNPLVLLIWESHLWSSWPVTVHLKLYNIIYNIISCLFCILRSFHGTNSYLCNNYD